MLCLFLLDIILNWYYTLFLWNIERIDFKYKAIGMVFELSMLYCHIESMSFLIDNLKKNPKINIKLLYIDNDVL